MALPLSAKQKKYLYLFVGFLFCVAGFLGSYILMIDQIGQIKRNIKKTVYQITKPAIPKNININIINSLRSGGHTIFIRHSARNTIKNILAFDQLSTTDQIVIPPNLYKGGCLNSQGKTEAWLLGEIFRKMNIPIGKIYASPTCRTIETAQLAFDRIDIIDNHLYVHSFNIGTNESRANAKNRALDIIKTVPEEGKNKVIVAHSKMLNLLGWHNSNLEESGLFIVKHRTNQPLKVITEITLGSLVIAMKLQKKH
ncbi:MAG: hypothetical protein CMH70_05490 [Nitrosomonadaceae bacterium]|nr:hypothetical protein [Nitrosomonadaceae bacterium]